MPNTAHVISEYEVFKNEKNALSFFFAHQSALDSNPTEGPFWFNVNGNKISAGTRDHHAVFEDVQSDIIQVAKKRGVVMLVEFENREPVRCTPCYFSDTF